MSYRLKEIKIRTDNSKEGMAKLDDMWRDIVSGKIPLMYDSDGKFMEGLSPVSVYSNYESDETGVYDLGVITVSPKFFTRMGQRAAEGKYKAYHFEGRDIGEAAGKAWQQVWEDQSEEVIHRAFTEDYESTVPVEYAKDGKAHCYLYISVQ